MSLFFYGIFSVGRGYINKNFMIIYKTINLINNKYYIGKDANNDPKYLGSGIKLKNAINKYGRENFKKEILFFCNDLKSLADKEREIVNEDVCKDPMSYNIAEGGGGGNTLLGASSEKIDNWKNNMSNAMIGPKNPMYNKTQSSEGKIRISNANKLPSHPNNNREGDKNPFFNKTHSVENKQRWSEERKGGGNPRAKPCVANGISYPSTVDAANAIGCHQSTIRQRINNKKITTYYYL